jgi:mRNA interferase HigB
VRIISRRALRAFWEAHPPARKPLSAWEHVVRTSQWTTPAELKQTFPSADFVGRLTVFNISGNHFRLVARIAYDLGIVFVRAVLTHKEYDRGDWKQDPWF